MQKFSRVLLASSACLLVCASICPAQTEDLMTLTVDGLEGSFNDQSSLIFQIEHNAANNNIPVVRFRRRTFGVIAGATLRWTGSEFELSNDLKIGNELQTDDWALDFLVDANDNNDDTSLEHEFTWYQDSLDAGDRMMQLERFTVDHIESDLFVDGDVFSNQHFDIAEGFWRSGEVEIGDVVAVDPERGDAVQRSEGAYDRRLLGVVSGKPGFVMGGFAFSVERLRNAWGDAVADQYVAEERELEEAVYASNAALAEERWRLASQTPRIGEQLSEEEAEAARTHQTQVADASMRLFFERHVAMVALAGRVPVKVDASFGAIRPGDPLTASPIPGVAMKAERPGPVLGTALEGLASGRDLILAFVNRGWYCSEPVRLAGSMGSGGALGDPRDAEIEALRSRLARLEAMLRPAAAAAESSRIQGRVSDFSSD